MKNITLAIASLTVCSTALAVDLTCAEDASTFRHMCFPVNSVRANGQVRAARLFQGGPNAIRETSITARAHCGSGALELTDGDGVAFARNLPAAQVGKDFVRYLCAHKKVRNDPKLSQK